MAFNVSLQGPSTFELSTSSSISIRTAKLTAADRARVPFTAEIGTPIPIVGFKDLAIFSSTVVVDRKILGKFFIRDGRTNRIHRFLACLIRRESRRTNAPTRFSKVLLATRRTRPCGRTSSSRFIDACKTYPWVLARKLIKYLLQSRSRRFTRAVKRIA